MKKIYFFFSILLCSFISFAQTQMDLPVTFDIATVNYGLVGFGGAEQSTIVTDPTLATNKVAKVIKTNTAELWAGTTITALAGTVQTSFANAIPFTATERRMNVRVWSPHTNIQIRLKVEDKNDPAKSCETEATFTGAANSWQTLEFNFNNQAAGTSAFNPTYTFNKVSIFFNFGTTGTVAGERIYYFDDVKFGAATVTPPTLTQMDLPVTFDLTTVDYGLVGFGGAEQSTIVTDPTLATNKVAKVIKTNTAELWAGTTVTALAGTVQTSFANAIPFTATERRMNVRVWSPHAGIPVRLKVEDKNDGTHSCETEATVTIASGWQTLEFNFNNQSAGTSAFNPAYTFNKVSIFFNFGTTGAVAGERIYYFDDVKFGAATVTPPSLTQMDLPVTFDLTTVDYGLVGFGGAEQSTIVTDPTLATNKVAKVIKTNTAELWAGTTVTALAGTVQTSFANAIPFTATERRMNVRVWSPHAGIPVRLKVEDKNDGTHSCETEATVTIASGWQTLEFNFNNQSAGTSAFNPTYTFNKVSIFFNFGTTGAVAGERIYYFDDVKFGAATVTPPSLTQMDLPVTFDLTTVDYGLVGFGGAEQSTIVTDPTLATNKVAKVIKTNTAELWAGTTVTALAGTVQTSFANAIPFTATERRMNVRVWSPHAGIPVRLKVEDKNDGTHSCETEATVTIASGWQTLEFNFNNQSAGTSAFNPTYTFNKVSIFFNFGTTGAVAGERIYYFDDVKFGAATVTPPTLTQMDLPVTFDLTTVDYGLVGFGGAEQSTIVTDPTLATNKVAKVIKTNTAELWAGTTVTALAGTVQTSFANAIPFTATERRMNVRVWSPHAGIPVRLKVEDKNDGTHSCETEATVTIASGWQTLEFNFNNQSAGTSAFNPAYTFNKVSIFFNFGTTGAVAGERIYYFDDVKFGAATVTPPTLTQMDVPVTFDDVTVNYGLVGFGGAEDATVVTDPTLATNKVGKVVKSNTAELWAGASITALAGTVQTSFANAIPFTATERRMNVRVWSAHTGIQIRLKVEDKNDGTRSCETEATFTGAANSWQTLEFNFNNQAAGTAAFNPAFTFNKATIFFNFGVTGAIAGARTYYFDDVKFGPATVTPPTLTQMDLPVTFDLTTVNYGLVGFGGAEQSTIVTDPTLATNKVAKVIKTNTAELWAGTTVTALAGTVQTSFANAIPFTATDRRMNVRVWSPHTNIQIRLKVEDKNDPAKSCETEATFTGAANSWQTLEFNFNNQAAGTAAFNPAFTFNKVSIFFNFGTTGATAGERIYYFDDVKFGGAPIIPPTLTQMDLPVTFDLTTVDYGLVGFGGAEQSTIVTDPTLATNKVAKVIKTNTAELWAGTTVTALAGTVQTSFANAIPFTATERRMNVRVWSPHTNIQVRLKVEDKTDPTKSCETEATFTGAANSWQTLEFNFNNQAAGTAAFNPAFTFNKVSIFFNFGTTGATAGERIYYFDDVKFGGANIPTAPIVVSPVNYCQNATAVPLTATATTGSTLLWYTVPTGGTGATVAPTPSTTVVGTINYYVSQVNALLIESPRSLIAVIVTGIPAAPVVTSPVTYCQNAIAVPLTATATAGSTLRWYTVATGGTASLTAPTPSTATAATTIYYVSQVNAGNCEGPRASISVVVNPAATLPTVTSPISYCQNAGATALSATGTNLKWYTTATGGFGSSTAPTPSTAVAGTTIFYVSQSTALGCEGPRAAISVVINALPAAPVAPAVSYCQNSIASPLTATAATGNTLRWYTAATGGIALPSAPTPITTTVGSITYYVSQVNVNGCEGPRAALVVQIKATPLAPSVTTPVSYCVNATSTILSATPDAGNSLLWYSVATGGVGSVNVPTTITNTSGNTNYYVSQTNAQNCESPRAAITVSIIAAPLAPSIGAAPYTRLFPGLSTTVSTASGPATGNTYSWFRNGVALAGQTGNAVIVNIDGLGNYSLKVTNANGCIGTSNVVTIGDSSLAKMFVYPNPSTGKFQVRYFSDNNNLKPRKITIYNSLGAIVYNASFVMFAPYTSMNIDMSYVASGIYYIHLMDNDGKDLSTETIYIQK